MRFYAITITPISGFATPLKGDTLFGQFCWQIANRPDSFLHGGQKFNDVIQNYAKGEKPFAVFSSAFPKLDNPSRVALKRPDLPAGRFFPLKDKKALKKKTWLPVELKAEMRIPNDFAGKLLTGAELVREISGKPDCPKKRRLSKISRSSTTPSIV